MYIPSISISILTSGFCFPPLNYFQCRHVTAGVLEADDETNTYATFVQETCDAAISGNAKTTFVINFHPKS